MSARQYGRGLGRGMWLWASVFVLLCVGVGLTADFETSPLKSKRTRTIQRPVEDVRAVPDARELLDFEPAVVPTSYGSRFGLSGLRAQAAAASPGIAICADDNTWDYQANDDGQRQIATLGGGGNVHFVWTHWFCCSDSLDCYDREVRYNAYNTASGLKLGDCGLAVSCQFPGCDPCRSRGGFPSIDVSTGDLAHPAFHMRNEISQDECGPPTNSCGPYSSFVLDQGISGLGLFTDNEMPGSRDAEAIWPHIAIDRVSGLKSPEDDVFHVAAHPTGQYGGLEDEILYWRRAGTAGLWEGPVVLDISAYAPLNHHVATNPAGSDVAIIYQRDQDNPLGLHDVLYVETADNGADWIAAGTPIFPSPVGPLVNGGRQYVTSYDNLSGPQSWLECTGEYDLDGRLHVVWVEQAIANVSSECRIRHWDDLAQLPRTIAEAIDFVNTGGDGGRDLWLAAPQIGFGDGTTLCSDGPSNPGIGGATSNRNYMYVSYEQYGGPTATEGNDVSWGGYQNLELYLAVSNDNGDTWSPPLNLTNTKTPGCDGTPGMKCASERDPSIALVVDDTIHMFYVLDTDAGDAVFGQGTWVFNPVMYYRIPGGTDVKPVCPTLAPSFSAFLSNSDPDCEYHTTFSPPGAVVEELTIRNLGNAALTGDVNVAIPAPDWLQLTTGAYTIAPGDPDDLRSVTMDAAAASVTGEGLYQAQIEITHNDTNKVSSKSIPVDFFVFDEFYCPEEILLHTGWLWLQVGNTAGIGGKSRVDGGLSRLNGDSSWSVYDASLIIGVPPNPDTLVWRNVYGAGNGQPGFRALSPLLIDTSAYGTAAGMATASVTMTTIDSSLGIDVTYEFPQGLDSSNFVYVEYSLFNRTGTPINGMSVGFAADFDVRPSPELDILQYQSQNTAHLLTNWNMVYQQGADSTGHAIVGDNSATRFKAGITSLQSNQAPRAWIAPNGRWLYESPGQGFHESYLYQNLTGVGFELFPPDDPNPEEDLHSVMVFDQDVDLDANGVKHYAMALVSSNVGVGDPTDLINSTKKAWKYAFGWVGAPYEIPYDSLSVVSAPYYARGTHEDGLGGGCSGCVVEMISGGPDFSIVPGPDPCYGEIVYSEVSSNRCGHVAVFRLRDLCGTYEDIIVVEMPPLGDCFCPQQCDLNGDGFVDSIDLAALIDVVFFGGINPRNPECPVTRSDLNVDCAVDAIDLSICIDYVFFGGVGPTDPCALGRTACWCE